MSDLLSTGVLSSAVRKAINEGHLAHMVTVNPDGSPQVSCVWLGVDDNDDVLSGHLFEQQKIRNLRRDPRIAISMEPGGTMNGLPLHFVLHGRATVEEGGCPELLQRLAVNYIGPGVKWPPMDDPPPGFVVRTRVERVVGYGQWTDE